MVPILESDMPNPCIIVDLCDIKRNKESSFYKYSCGASFRIKIIKIKKIIVSLLKAAWLLGMKASLPGLRFLKRLLESETQSPRSLPSWFEWVIVRKENPSFPPASLSPSSQLISIYSNSDRTPVMPAPQEGF